MNIQKATVVATADEATATQLEAINVHARAKLTAQQVYVFSLRLCDDQIDRDGERFDTAALPTLAKLFVGKTGIVDHRWSAQSQVARIFETQVVKDGDVSYIRAWAYIRRGGQAEELIADIEAGIKKEVSVGCAMGRAVCSICGATYSECGHQKGEAYDGQICHVILREPMDAYEFSFVAVPAQRDAGVVKAACAARTLKEAADEYGAQTEYHILCEQARLGRAYEKQMQNEVVRLMLSLDMGISEPILRSAAAKIGIEELQAIHAALQAKAAAYFPVQTQLFGASARETIENGFLI